MQHFTGTEYTKIAIANAFGLDKLTWNERLDWANDNHGVYLDKVGEADEKFLYIKAVKALRDTEAGIPTGFIMGLDSTSSGFQLASVLTGCRDTAERTNVIGTGKREDLYEYLTDHMNNHLSSTDKVVRSQLKDATMTRMYGSTAEPKRVFGEDSAALEEFERVLVKETEGAMDFLNMTKQCKDPNSLGYSWNMPDGHRVVTKSMVTVKGDIDTSLAGERFTYRMKLNRANRGDKSLSANV